MSHHSCNRCLTNEEARLLQKGSINLFTIRHDQGQIRHVFRSSTISGQGHQSNAAVSVLALGSDETSMLSGGWDNAILVRFVVSDGLNCCSSRCDMLHRNGI